MPSANLVLDSTLKPPGDVQAKLLRQIVLSGLGDHVARLVFRHSYYSYAYCVFSCRLCPLLCLV